MEITTLKKQRKAIVAKITRIHTFVFTKYTNESNLSELEVRNDELQKVFKEIQSQIDETEPKIDENYCESIENKYYATTAQIKTLTDK